MSTFEELKNQADPLRRKGKFALALPSYEEMWEKYRGRCGIWDGWAYAQCLYREKKYPEALSLCRTLYGMDRDLVQVKHLYAWCIYRTEIRKDTIDDPARFLRAASAILTLCNQEDAYSPYTMTIMKVLDFYSNPFNPEKLLEWTAKLDPEKLSPKGFSFQDESGQIRELASPLERYFTLRTEALLETGAYDECASMCLHALKSIERFHHHNDLWIKRRLAHARWKTGRTEEAMGLLKGILAVKREWFIRKEIAQLYLQKGEPDKALRYAVEAALDPGEADKKVRLYELLAEIFNSLGNQEAARKHVSLACAIRQARGWKVPEALAEIAANLGAGLDEPGDEGTLHKDLFALWEKIHSDMKPPLQGRISKLLPNGKAGFIETQEGRSYYFRLNSFRGRRDRAVPGTEVWFYLEDGFDAKKNRPSQVAVDVKEIQGRSKK
ncbi:MAG: hypothetical protein AB1512_20240 [Thermodesulfobacteriota bacterium]